MKAASEWILSCLNEHPEICATSYKEINFFNKSYNYKKGLGYYYTFFKHCPNNKIKGEYTPSYMLSPQVAQLIRKNFPDVKIIACLRNPVDRAYSDYRYNIQWNGRFKIFNDFEDTMKNDLDFVERGFYYKQLKNYFEIFPREQILILFFEDLKKNPRDFIQKIYEFLGVKNTNFIPSQVNQRRNITGQYIVKNKIPIINRIIYWIYFKLENLQMMRDIIEKSNIEGLFTNLMNFNKKRIRTRNIDVLTIEPLNKETRDYLLNTIYKDDMRKLESLLDVDLSFWKKQ